VFVRTIFVPVVEPVELRDHDPERQRGGEEGELGQARIPVSMRGGTDCKLDDTEREGEPEDVRDEQRPPHEPASVDEGSHTTAPVENLERALVHEARTQPAGPHPPAFGRPRSALARRGPSETTKVPVRLVVRSLDILSPSCSVPVSI